MYISNGKIYKNWARSVTELRKKKTNNFMVVARARAWVASDTMKVKVERANRRTQTRILITPRVRDVRRSFSLECTRADMYSAFHCNSHESERRQEPTTKNARKGPNRATDKLTPMIEERLEMRRRRKRKGEKEEWEEAEEE